MKKFFKVIGITLGVLVLLAALGLLLLSVFEYRPAYREAVELEGRVDRELTQGKRLNILSWNVGYGGLGAESDFFMDGGTSVQAANKLTVQRYLSGMKQVIDSQAPDILLLQEVDQSSARSYFIDERSALANWGISAFAKNFSAFVPYPLPPIGYVQSGIYTVSNYIVTEAFRESLPCPFSWPIRTANLKRCMLVSYLSISNTDKKLVLINLHLEAYDDGEGKGAQIRQVMELIQKEYEAGNYVIVGGDFNHVFPGSEELYPITTRDLWNPGTLEESYLPEGFTALADLSTPTCRLLNEPYDPETAQFYVIDGFIVSPNVIVESVETLDLEFRDSDHNPVRLQVRLG